MYLIVGLGNPGKEYELTRHNVGFIAVDKIISNHGFSSGNSKFNSIIYTGIIDDKKIIIAKPLTYMNRSGDSISQIVKYYKIDLKDIIIIHDELDIKIGKVKIKTGGSSGGHNGIKSIDNHLGKDYKRIRIGIDHPGDKDLVSDYVLSNFSKIERSFIDYSLEYITDYISLILDGKDDLFLKKINDVR